MSFRFNKSAPEDFGLEYIDDKFIRPSDGSEWVMHNLYDFGWGQENGFYRKPLGSFDELINMVASDEDSEDSYGAAAMIDELYQMELKNYLLTSMTQDVPDRVKKKLNDIFRLSKGTNRTASVGLTLGEINKECDDWTSIADYYSKYEKKRSITSLFKK